MGKLGENFNEEPISPIEERSRRNILEGFQKNIESEKMAIDFTVLGGEISEKNYQFKNYSIEELEKGSHIFKLTLHFKKRKNNYISYSRTKELFFYYNGGDSLTYKYNNEYIKVYLGPKIAQKKVYGQNEIQVYTEGKQTAIQMGDTKVIIQFLQKKND